MKTTRHPYQGIRGRSGGRIVVREATRPDDDGVWRWFYKGMKFDNLDQILDFVESNVTVNQKRWDGHAPRYKKSR